MPCNNGMENYSPSFSDLRKAEDEIRRLTSYVCALQNEIKKMHDHFIAEKILSDAEINGMADGLSGFIAEHEKDDIKRLIKAAERNSDIKMAACIGNRDRLLSKMLSNHEIDILIKVYSGK